MSSSGVTSRASCLVEGIGAWFPCLCAGMSCFKWPWNTTLSSLLWTPLSYSTHWSSYISHIQKPSLYKPHLAWEAVESGGYESTDGDNSVHPRGPPIWWILLSINFDIPTEQELMVSIFELSRFEGEPFPHMAHHTPPFSQRVCFVTRLHGHSITAMATYRTAPFRRKASPHIGEPNCFYHDVAMINYVALQGQVLSQSLPHMNTQYRISFGDKRCHSKHRNNCPFNNEIKERQWKNTVWDDVSIRRVFPLWENIGSHITWPNPRVIWEGMADKQGGLLATNIFLETGQEQVKISCKWPDTAFVSNSPRKHTQGIWKEIVRWNVACIEISCLSLSLSLSLSASSSFTFSRILLIQGYLCWSRLAYLNQESSQILSPRFYIIPQNSYQI